MNHLVECTLPEKILLAASTLEEQGQTPFSAEALIVCAWQKYPNTFGLKGYEEQYPDSNRVLAMIMGEKGLSGRGWLAKVGQKQYTLTRDGKQIVRKLQAGEQVPPLTARRTARLTREQDLLMQQLLATSAYQKTKRGEEEEWTFSDACRFWSIGEKYGGVIDARLDELTAKLTEIERGLKAGPVELGNGWEVSVEDADRLCEIHGKLEQRFTRHLALLRNRG